MKKALIVIDLQKDYFPGGKFELWNTEKTLSNILKAIKLADSKDIPVILVQHVADASKGIAPFFNEGTEGVNILPEILDATPNNIIVIKHWADGFFKTNLHRVLKDLGVHELLICGMMTQNCVAFTAISNSAEKYKVKVLGDCCTTVSESIHLIGLNALSTRVNICNYKDVIK